MDELVNELLQQAFLRCSEMIQNEFDAETKAPTVPADCSDRKMFMQRLPKQLQAKIRQNLNISIEDDETEVAESDACTCS